MQKFESQKDRVDCENICHKNYEITSLFSNALSYLYDFSRPLSVWGTENDITNSDNRQKNC